MIVYISGAISTDAEYKKKFRVAEKLINNEGHAAINPAELHEEKITWEDAMRADIAEMMRCAAVVVLPTWKRSRGAKIEINLAKELKIPIYTIDKFVLLARKKQIEQSLEKRIKSDRR